MLILHGEVSPAIGFFRRDENDSRRRVIASSLRPFMSAPANATPLVSANGLVVRYGVQTLLDGSTIALHEGERVGLVGRNGCGKSTLLRIIAGDLEPDAGKVSRRRGCLTGYLPQAFDLDRDATVEANIL